MVNIFEAKVTFKLHSIAFVGSIYTILPRMIRLNPSTSI